MDELSSFLGYYTSLESISNSGYEYYRLFKKTFILSTGSVPAVEDLLQKLNNYASIYSDYKNGSISNASINSILKNIVYTGKNVFIPLILKMLNQWNNGTVSGGDTIQMLRYLEAYIIRRDILELPTHSLGQAMLNMLRNSDTVVDYESCINGLNTAQRMPDDGEMQTQLLLRDFYHLSNSYYYLERLEKFVNPAFALTDPTIEHILPETMHTNAFPKPGVANPNDYNWELDLGPDANRIHDTYQHTLENLTILPRGENARMGDYRFDKKKNWTSIVTGGFNYGYLHTPIRISQSLGTFTTWGESEIRTRCADMVNRVCTVWPHP